MAKIICLPETLYFRAFGKKGKKSKKKLTLYIKKNIFFVSEKIAKKTQNKKKVFLYISNRRLFFTFLPNVENQILNLNLRFFTGKIFV